MTKQMHLELGYVVKEPLTGKFLDDDFQLVGLNEAEQFYTKQAAQNFRRMASGRLRHGILKVVEVKTTIEEV